MACSGKSRPTIRSPRASSCAGSTPSCAAATSNSTCRVSLAARMVALSVWWVTRLAKVPVSSGLVSLSTVVTFTFSMGTPSSWAAICRMTVRAPCPISTLPSSTSTLPSGRIFTTTWLGSPPPLMPVEYQPAAMPFPRLLTMGASVRALPGCHLQQVGVQPETCPFGRRLHDLDQTAVVLNRPGGGGVAVPDGVEEAQPPGVDANSLGDALHLHVPGKGRLEQTAPPHRGGR